jgi:hypothetical protein
MDRIDPNLLKIKKNIYNAQCIGNVEPIEFMIPYPSMRSLIEGQNIKYSKQTIIEKPNITNLDFYNYIQRTANWLESIGAKPKQSIIIPNLEYPQSEILLYGIWQLGAVAVINSYLDHSKIANQLDDPMLLSNKISLFNEIKNFPEKYNPKYKPNLSEEALITFETSNGIKLSHYNLLVNANSIQKALNIKSRTKIYCNLEPNTSAWAVFKAILPIYSGCIFDKDNPDLSINTQDGDYLLRYDFKNLKNFSKNDIAICPENTAAISVGPHPIHLTDFFLNKSNLKIKGHSLMMGYLDQQLNNSCFKKDGFFIYF